jgi:hypothetical protein
MNILLRENLSHLVSLQINAPSLALFVFSVLFIWFLFMVLFLAWHWAMGSLQTQEVNVFSSNPFEDLELVGFALRLGCSKLGAKNDFLFLAMLGLVQGAWRL